MNCREIQPLFSKMIDRALGDGEEKIALDHLSKCGSCRKRYAALNRVSELISESLESHPFNDRLANLTLNMLPSRRLAITPARSKRPVIISWLAAAAAVALIAVGLVIIFTGPSETPPRVAIEAPEILPLKTGINKLADGSRIDLWENGSGSVKYDEESTEVVLESGTLHARVVKQKTGIEFLVRTGDMKIVVVGTEFFVAVTETGTVCMVREGKVNCVPLRNVRASKFVPSGYAFNSQLPEQISPVTVFPIQGASGAAVEPAPTGAAGTEPLPPSIGGPDVVPPADPTGDNAVNTDMPIGGPKKKEK